MTRFKFKIREGLASELLSVRMFVAIPIFVLAFYLNVLNTYTILVLVYATFNIPIVTIIMRSFIDEIPVEIEKSGMIDGCTRMGSFLRLALPLCRDAILSVLVLSAIFSWNEFLFATILTRMETRTLPVIAAQTMTQRGIEWGPAAALTIIIAGPMLIFGILIQKYRKGIVDKTRAKEGSTSLIAIGTQRGSRGNMTTTKILFATDVHGSERSFLKFLNAGKLFRVDVLILSGDLTGKSLIPVTEENGVYTADVLGKIQTANSKTELELLEKELRSTGHYYYHTTRAEFSKLREDKSKIEEFFGRLIDDRIRAWVSMAEQRLKGTGTKCWISPGNDDRFSIDPILDASEFVANPEGKALEIDASHEMITLGWSNPTPWNTPRECPEPELEKKIEHLVSQVANLENSIFNFHCPPYNSLLDMAPKIENTALKARTYNVPVGSTAVRRAIEKHKPMLGLHGHIHESRGSIRIGRTLCLNPGSEYTEGTLRAYLVTFDEKGLKGYQPISG